MSYVARDTLGEHFRMIADGRYSWTWRIPEDERRRAADEVRSWAEDRYGDLETPRPRRHRIRFRAFDLRH